MPVVQSAFNISTGEWDVAWPGRVSRHDVVYLSPPADPLDGLPIGNGEVGALCWVEHSRIMIVMNKADLWDDAAFGRFHNWAGEEEERSTTLRHGGRIVIDFHAPIFDCEYLDDCKGRISLADGSVSLSVDGPLGRASFRAFVSHDTSALCCEVAADLADSTPIEVTIERYGSRMLHHWYLQDRGDPRLGIAGTDAVVNDQGMTITHKLTSGTFALGARVLCGSGAPVRYERRGSHVVRALLPEGTQTSFTLLADVTSPQSGDPVLLAQRRLDGAQKTGACGLFDAHAAAWKAFWLRSLMDTGDDMLDNVWHLTMYYARGSQGGSYPGRFIGGLWNHARDFQAWGFYFHWNQQQVYWPLNAAGHHDLVDAYLTWRFRSLPHAKADARDVLGVPGAVVSDVVERRGYNSQTELSNHTPVAQIAMEFWRQYAYTRDASFLTEHALPYILAAAEYFESLFEKGDDGLYHAEKGTGYEGNVLLRDCLSELACAHALFPTALRALQVAGRGHPRAESWRELCENLALPVTVTADPRVIEPGSLRYLRGRFRNHDAGSDEMLAAGHVLDEGRNVCSLEPNDEEDVKVPGDELDAHIHNRPAVRIETFLRKLAGGDNPYVPATPDMAGHRAIFPYIEYAAVFPCGVIGLSREDERLFNAACNTVKVYASSDIGWDPAPIVLARLGLGRELNNLLSEWGDVSPLFPNGFCADGPSASSGPDAPLSLRTHQVNDLDTEGRTFRRAGEPFRHMGMERTSTLACAMNEMLLQSHDGIIRVAPAVAPDQNARFTLHAVGGVVVSSEIENGAVLWIHLNCRVAGPCRAVNPWSEAFVFRNRGFERSSAEPIIDLDVAAGDRIAIVPDREVVEQRETAVVTCKTRQAPLFSPKNVTVLGLPRMF